MRELGPRRTSSTLEATLYLCPAYLPSDVKAQHDPIRASEVVRHYAPVRLAPAGVPLFATKCLVGEKLHQKPDVGGEGKSDSMGIVL